jgi:hypothetical protein
MHCLSFFVFQSGRVSRIELLLDTLDLSPPCSSMTTMLSVEVSTEACGYVLVATVFLFCGYDRLKTNKHRSVILR